MTMLLVTEGFDQLVIDPNDIWLVEFLKHQRYWSAD